MVSPDAALRVLTVFMLLAIGGIALKYSAKHPELTPCCKLEGIN